MRGGSNRGDLAPPSEVGGDLRPVTAVVAGDPEVTVIRSGVQRSRLGRRLGKRRNHLKRITWLEGNRQVVVGEVWADSLPVIAEIARTPDVLEANVECARFVLRREEGQLEGGSQRRITRANRRLNAHACAVRGVRQVDASQP